MQYRRLISDRNALKTANISKLAEQLMKLFSQGVLSNRVSVQLFGFKSELEYQKDPNYCNIVRSILSIKSK